MPKKQDSRDWIELVVKAAKLFGMNPVRVRWKLRAYQERAGKFRLSLSSDARAITRQHKMCPRCKAMNSADANVCHKCGAKLRSRQLEVLDRLLGKVSFGAGPEVFILACFVLCYVAVALNGPGSDWLGMSGRDLVDAGGMFPPLVLRGQWWRFLTSIFLHANLWHIGFNCFALMYVSAVAREVYGGHKSLAVFIAGGALASLASFAWRAYIGGAMNSVSIGGSGAISALIGLVLVWGHRDGTAFGIWARNSMARWILYTTLFGLLVGSVDHSGHIGGWVAGGLLSLIVPTNLNLQARAGWKIAGALSGLVCALCTALVVYLSFFALSPP